MTAIIWSVVILLAAVLLMGWIVATIIETGFPRKPWRIVGAIARLIGGLAALAYAVYTVFLIWGVV